MCKPSPVKLGGVSVVPGARRGAGAPAPAQGLAAPPLLAPLAVVEPSPGAASDAAAEAAPPRKKKHKPNKRQRKKAQEAAKAAAEAEEAQAAVDAAIEEAARQREALKEKAKLAAEDAAAAATADDAHAAENVNGWLVGLEFSERSFRGYETNTVTIESVSYGLVSITLKNSAHETTYDFIAMKKADELNDELKAINDHYVALAKSQLRETSAVAEVATLSNEARASIAAGLEVVLRFHESSHPRTLMAALTAGKATAVDGGIVTVHTYSDGMSQTVNMCDIITEPTDDIKGIRLVPLYSHNSLANPCFWPSGQPVTTRFGQTLFEVPVLSLGCGSKGVEEATFNELQTRNIYTPNSVVAVSVDDESQTGHSRNCGLDVPHIHLLGDLKDLVIDGIYPRVVWVSMSCSPWSDANRSVGRSKKDVIGDLSKPQVVESFYDLQATKAILKTAIARNPDVVVVWETTDNVLKYLDKLLDFFVDFGFDAPNSYPRCKYAHKTSGCSYEQADLNGCPVQHDYLLFTRGLTGWRPRLCCAARQARNGGKLEGFCAGGHAQLIGGDKHGARTKQVMSYPPLLPQEVMKAVLLRAYPPAAAA